MAPAAVYLIISTGLTLSVTLGLALRVLFERRRLRRRFGPVYDQLLVLHGRRRGRARLREASERFDRELRLLGEVTVRPQRHSGEPSPEGEPSPKQ